MFKTGKTRSNTRIRSTAAALFFFSFLLLPLSALAASALKDSSLWICRDGYFDIIENTMFLQGKLGGAVHTGAPDQNEIISFKAKFTLSDPDHSWVAFKFRSDNPGGQIWENENTYFFLIREGSVEAGRKTGGGPVELLVQKDTGGITQDRYHQIEVGVRNHGINRAPRLLLAVDGKTIIEYDDHGASDILKNSSSFFSVNVYRDAGIELVTEPGAISAMGSRIAREIPVTGSGRLDSYDRKWGIIQHVEPGPLQYYHADVERNGSPVRLNGLGSIVYKDIVSYSVLSFNISVSERSHNASGSATVLLNKSNRDSYFGDYGYGLRFFPDGKLGLTAYEGGPERRYPAVETGLDFRAGQRITVEMVRGGDMIEFYIFAGEPGIAYKYEVTDIMPVDNGGRFIGLVNSSMPITAVISNIAFRGSTADYSNPEPVKAVYLQDYFVHEGSRMLHWVYRADQPCYYKTIITDGDNNKVGESLYPRNTFHLPPGSDYGSLYLTAVNLDGARSEKVMVDLKEEPAQYHAGPMERIAIRPDSTTGAYFYTPGRGEFIINGVNYTVLRFGDHATFEPAHGFVPASYDPFTADSLLKLLKKKGFNTVRVFVAGGRTGMNPGTGGDYETTMGLSSDYMDNFVDFLARAKKYGIYVLPNFCENELPNNSYFASIGQLADTQDILFTQKGLEAKLLYINLFLNYIKEKDEELLTALLAVQAQNEFVYYTGQQPFIQTSGYYTFFGSGLSYDMADAGERRRLANDAMKHYFKALKEEITSVDPGLLLTVGTGTLRHAGIPRAAAGLFPGDYAHTPMTGAEYLDTEIDFLDIHSYNYNHPGLTGRESVTRDIEDMLLDTPESLESRKRKPVIMGEYSSFMHLHDSYDEATSHLIDQRNAALELGLKGVLVWSFDTFLLDGLYAVMEDGGDFLEQLARLEPVHFAIPAREPGAKTALYISLAALTAALILFAVLYTGSRSSSPARQASRKLPEHVTHKTPADNANTGGSGEITVPASNTANLAALKRKLAEISLYPFTCNFFGQFSMHYRGKPVRDGIFSSIKAKELLIYLLVENRGITKNEIVTDLWEGSRSKKPDAVFHATLYNLRNSLKKINPGYEYIVCENRLYSVQAGLFFSVMELYNHDLERLLKKDILLDEEISVIEHIAGYYKGEFLYACDSDWATRDREYYHALYERSVLKVCGNNIGKGDNLHAIRDLKILIGYNPYLEDAYKLLLTAYANLRDRSSLHRAYENYKKLMLEEYNANPSDEMTNLYKELSEKQAKPLEKENG